MINKLYSVVMPVSFDKEYQWFANELSYKEGSPENKIIDNLYAV